MDTYKTIGQCTFNDVFSGEECYMVVRQTEDGIGLALSIMTNGDVEVFFNIDKGQQLIDWLTLAVNTVKNNGKYK